MDHPPLALLANGLLGALNELRHCAPLSLRGPIASVTQVRPVASWGPAFLGSGFGDWTSAEMTGVLLRPLTWHTPAAGRGPASHAQQLRGAPAQGRCCHAVAPQSPASAVGLFERHGGPSASQLAAGLLQIFASPRPAALGEGAGCVCSRSRGPDMPCLWGGASDMLRLLLLVIQSWLREALEACCWGPCAAQGCLGGLRTRHALAGRSYPGCRMCWRRTMQRLRSTGPGMGEAS